MNLSQRLKREEKRVEAFLNLVHQRFLSPAVQRIRHPAPKVAVIELCGVIGAGRQFHPAMLSYSATEKAISRAFSLRGVRAVVLRINSPGGSPVQSELIYRHIRTLAEEKNIPVYSFAEDIAASGGYWLACAGDRIYAQEASIIGSIGVISSGFGLEEFIKRHGITRRLYAQGENKAMLDPFLPEKEEDILRLNAIQADIHESFKTLVKTRRGDALDSEAPDLFTGAVWTGKKAQKLGLVDGVGDMHTVLKTDFGDNVQLKYMSGGKKLFSRLLGGGKAQAAPGDWVDAVLGRLEARALWARFGL